MEDIGKFQAISRKELLSTIRKTDLKGNPCIFIDNSADLALCCQDLSARTKNYVYIDTEFIRRSTYFPNLCLIQCASDNPHYPPLVIDILQADIDLTPFKSILLDKRITKVFHDCSQDIEALNYRLRGCLPYPIYDTQVAGLLCGLGSLSFKNLVAKLLGIILDKTSQCSPWEKRPLTEDQVRYAYNEVVYLRCLHSILHQHLYLLHRDTWIADDMVILLQRFSKKSYLRLALSYPASSVAHQRIAALEAWRESEAQSQNKPRQWILSDALLLQSALTSQKIPPIPSSFYYGLPYLEKGQKHPRIARRISPHPLQKRLNEVCQKHGFSAAFFLQGCSLDQLMDNHTHLTGWRKRVWNLHSKRVCVIAN